MLASVILPSFLLLSWSGTAKGQVPYAGGAFSVIGSSASKGLSDVDLGLFEPFESSIVGGSLAGSAKRDLQHPKQLVSRQSVCQNPSYGLCPSRTYCCPLGGQCCTAGDCCASGSHCCTGGDCCKNTHNCVVVGGVRGCCPIGTTCTAGATQCADPGYVACVGETFCCRPGDICSRDSTGGAICTPPGITTRSTTTTPAPGTTFIDLPPSSAPPPPVTTPILVPTTQTVVVPTTTTAPVVPTTMTPAQNTNTGPLFSFPSNGTTTSTSAISNPQSSPRSGARGFNTVAASTVAAGVLACFVHVVVTLV